jgi:hypothetical protein
MIAAQPDFYLLAECDVARQQALQTSSADAW